MNRRDATLFVIGLVAMAGLWAYLFLRRPPVSPPDGISTATDVSPIATIPRPTQQSQTEALPSPPAPRPTQAPPVQPTPWPTMVYPSDTPGVETTATPSVDIGVWRFESDPTISNGMRTYRAYFWLMAKDKPIILKDAPSLGLPREDYGLCEQTDAYIDTKEGQRYKTGLSSCPIGFIGSNQFTLFPGFPTTGNSTYFFLLFTVPYKESPVRIGFPAAGKTLPLPDISAGPYVDSPPPPDRSRWHALATTVKVNEAVDISVLRMSMVSLSEDSYLVKVDVHFTNRDKSSNYAYTIERSLLGSHGVVLPSAETGTGYLLGGVSETMCPNQVSRLGNGVTVNANSATDTSYCFEIGKPRQPRDQYLPDMTDSYYFNLALDKVDVGFYGKAVQSNP